ncbi:hypothetical protein JHK82_031374 [Glycine max]|nr:hypothetical protein JHK82_031374 [Glycine max]
MTILRKFGPPLQWSVVPIGPSFHGKYVAEPWYRFLAEGDFVHGDELLFYYRSHEDIWETGPSNWLAAIRFSATFRVSKGRARSVLATRRHIFTADATEHMMQHSFPLLLPPAALNFLFGSQKVIPVQRAYGRCNQRQITMHDGVPSVAQSWFQYLSKNNLMAGDEVIFFFRFDEHFDFSTALRPSILWTFGLASSFLAS